MGSTGLKVAIGAFLVWLSAQMGTFADEILLRVRESVQASELLEIDRWVFKASVFDDERGKTHAPRDQAEFERILKDSLQASGGRDVTRDRWERPYVYDRVARRDPREVCYRIASEGADRKGGTEDDIVVERENERSSINRDPSKIAELAIERKQRLDREVASRVKELAERAKVKGRGPGDDKDKDREKDPTAERAVRELESATRELARMLERG